MYDIIFEKKKKFYCYIYLLDQKSWEQSRIMTSVVLGIAIGGFMYMMEMNPYVCVLATLLIAFIMIKLTYIQLINLDRAIGKHLKMEFPNFAITLASMLSTYDNVTNALEKAYEYNEDIYYRHLLSQLIEANIKYPEDFDKNVFDFCNEIPSNNSIFLGKTLIDFKDKGYDAELLDKLVANLNVESSNLAQTIVESANAEFIKFGTAPIMISMGYIFAFALTMFAEG